MTKRRVIKVSAQSGAFSSSMSVMSLYWELQAPSADSMASTFSRATAMEAKAHAWDQAPAKTNRKD